MIVNTVKARICSIYNDKVLIDVLIDEENATFQTRIFDMVFLTNLKNQEEGSFFYLKTSKAPGIVMIEALEYDGFDTSSFEVDWSTLKDFKNNTGTLNDK